MCRKKRKRNTKRWRLINNSPEASDNKMYSKKLTLVAGLPGTGKTTFARALAAATGAVHLNSDMVRQKMGKQGQYDPASKEIVYKELLHRTAQHLKNNRAVVVDATFYKNKMRKPFIELANKENAPVFWIKIKADENTIKKRVDKKRRYSEADFEVYKKIKATFEPLQLPHLTLWSDRQTVEEMVASAHSFLQSGEKRF
ncbi:MAG TPA: ATP-binding protein [Bacteroidetes bacterium]|nr:ATP-binding protein [Bacteroidota bacterium]